MVNATILILEDDPVSRLFLEKTFQGRSEFTALAAKDGETAVSIAHEQKIDVIIADIGLPGIDGIETARQILARQDVAVIFLSGNSDPGTMERAAELQPYAVRTKPVDVEGLLGLCEQATQARELDQAAFLSPGFLLDTLYDTAEIGMCVTDADRRFVKVNRAYRDTYGYEAVELLGHEFTKVLPEADRAEAARMHDEFIEGSIVEIPQDWRVQQKDGDIRDIFVTAGRMIGNDGRPYKVTTVTDVTARKKNRALLEDALRQKEILLREVHHRVKNNLNTLSSIISLQQNQVGFDTEVGKALRLVMNRIRAISSVYERLHHAGGAAHIDIKEYITGLVHDITASADYDKALDTTVQVSPGETDLDRGVAMGLIVNELVTNSIKHGSPQGQALSITVEVALINGKYVIDVSDTGVGLPSDFQPAQTNTLGIQLLQALTGQHGGTLAVKDHASAHFQVTIPGSSVP